MICKDCLHYDDVCDGYIPSDLDQDVWDYCEKGMADQIPDIEKRCDSFKNKADFVEVCHCEKCKHYELYEQIEDFDGRCTLSGIEFDKDFHCGYGERKGAK